MRIAPSLLAALAALVFPAAAFAVPPGNDNYLASVPIESSPFQVTVDTTEATTQADTLQPEPRGRAVQRRRAGDRRLQGRGVRQDRLVRPAAAGRGAVELSARRPGSRRRRALRVRPRQPEEPALVDCTTGGGDDLQLAVKGGSAYTIQIGGAAGAGGPGSTSARRTSRTVTRTTSSTSSTSARTWPAPSASTAARRSSRPCRADLRPVGSGARIASLYVDRVLKGAKIVAKCAGCGSQTITRQEAGPRLAVQARRARRSPTGARSRSASRCASPAPAPIASAPPASTSSTPTRTASSSAQERCLNVEVGQA